MLSKLIKYDLRYFYKMVGILYLIIFALAVIARLSAAFPDIFILTFIHDFSVTMAFGLAFGTIVNICTRVWLKYNFSFYGDEAYLTHTLPIQRRTIWTAKFLTSLILIATSLLVFLPCFLIIVIKPDTIKLTLSALSEHTEFWPLFFAAICVLFCQTSFIIQCGFLGITLGHRFRSHRALLTIIFGFLIYLFCESILVGFTLIWALINPNIMTLLIDGTIENNLSYLTELLISINVAYILFNAGCYIVNAKLLQHGIDVE